MKTKKYRYTGKDFDIQRKMRKDLQDALTKAGIKMPQTHMEVRNGK